MNCSKTRRYSLSNQRVRSSRRISWPSRQKWTPYIEKEGELRGLLIQSETFPGWRDFGSLISHLSFVRNHHKHIKKVAAVTDSAFAAIAPTVASHFVSADVRHFAFADRDAAMTWLRET